MEQLFTYNGTQVETLCANDTVYFNPYHVGACLEMSDSAVRKAILNMTDKQAVKLTNSDVKKGDIRKLNNAGELFLTESGVYKLAFRSNKPQAEAFTNWVTDEVLPSIRRTGEYKVDVLGKKVFCDPYRYNGKIVYVARELAEKLGCDRSGVSNTIRLNKAFVEGVDYFTLWGAQMSAFKIENRGAYRGSKSLTILSEDGYTKVASFYGAETERDISEVCILPEAPAPLPMPQDEQSALVCGVVERMGQLTADQLKAMYMLLGCLQK